MAQGIPTYYVQFDAAAVLRSLRLTQKDMRKIARRMMAKSLQAARKDIRREYRGGTLRKRSGRLAKNIKYKAGNDFRGMLRVASWYASTHEDGAHIVAKKKSYLTFEINGNWVKKKEVYVPARPVVAPIAKNYYSVGGKAEPIMESTLQIELDKLFAKG